MAEQLLPRVILDLPGQWRQMNLALLLLVMAAIGIGICFIYGIGQQTGGTFASKWIRQLAWAIIGTGILLGLAALDYEHLGRFCGWIYGGSVLLLVLVLFFGLTINNARSWLMIGGGIGCQPSEFAKFGLIILLARLAAKPSIHVDKLRYAIPLLGLALVPMGLIMLQPDYGSALILVPITLAILFVSGFKTRWLVYAAIVAVALSPFVWNKGLKEYQRQRIYTFAYPMIPKILLGDRKPPNISSEGWNARQSLLAVGSGGLTGKGFMKGTQNALGFLPRSVAPTDFIFSVIAEETGLLGSALLLFIFWGILLLSIYTAMRARDDFGRNLCCGIAMLICAHIYVNVGMNIGMAPIIGIPLPFVSSGGSFMLVMLGCIGVIQSVYIRRRRY